MTISSDDLKSRQILLVCSRCGSKYEISKLTAGLGGFWQRKTLCFPCFEDLFPRS